MTYQVPRVLLQSYASQDDVITTILRFQDMPLRPLAPSWLAEPTNPRNSLIELHRAVAREGLSVTFFTFESRPIEIKAGHVYNFTATWSPSQLEIAQSSQDRWRRERFRTSDMLALQNADGSTIGRKLGQGDVPKEGIVVPKGWEHEHCSLCWKTISESTSFKHAGYTDGRDWICNECYGKYIVSGFGKKLGDFT